MYHTTIYIQFYVEIESVLTTLTSVPWLSYLEVLYTVSLIIFLKYVLVHFLNRGEQSLYLYYCLPGFFLFSYILVSTLMRKDNLLPYSLFFQRCAGISLLLLTFNVEGKFEAITDIYSLVYNLIFSMNCCMSLFLKHFKMLTGYVMSLLILILPLHSNP